MQQQSENQPDQHKIYNDAIDLAALIRALWAGKWVVIKITSVSLALALIYLMVVPRTFIGSLDIMALPNDKADVYRAINATQFLEVDKHILLLLFKENIQLLDVHEYDFETCSPDKCVLKFTTQDPETSSQILADSLVRGNQNIDKRLANTFMLRINEQSRIDQFAIEDLEVERKSILSQYHAVNKTKLAILREHAEIARHLDISTGSQTTQIDIIIPGWSSVDSGGKSYPMEVVANTDNLYLRGYAALEKKVMVLESRQQPEIFIPDLARIDFLTSQLLNNNLLMERSKIIMANTPIGTDQFASGVYDLDLLEYRIKTQPLLVILLSIVLGVMFGIFVLLVRNALINKD